MTAVAQKGLPQGKVKELVIDRAAGAIRIDGLFTETEWQKPAKANHFIQHFPSDTCLAGQQTEVRLCFDDHYLYLAATCYQTEPYTVQTLKRDFSDARSDIFAVNLDPFLDHLNGFYFGVNPYGVQKEGQVFNGSELNTDWDNKWFAAVKRFPDRWTVEMAIPFKSIRYKQTPGRLPVWGINFMRTNAGANERSTWVPISRNFALYNINFTGRLYWNAHPPDEPTSFAILPYGLTGVAKDFQAGTKREIITSAGLDAKVAVTPSLNLDLTLNPDFAQVDVDQQVTDLSRFELFFPERRQFFIENSDLFSSFGSPQQAPFFSRRIGLSSISGNATLQKVPIVAGARLSGRLNPDWRIGLMNIQTAAMHSDSLPATNFLAVAFQRRIFNRSNLVGFLVNKTSFNNKNTAAGIGRYNRVAGLETNLASVSGKWVGKAFVHHSFDPAWKGSAFSAGLEMGYLDNHFLVSPALYNIDKYFQAATGFIPRNGIINHPMVASWFFYPRGRVGKWINTISAGPDYEFTYDKFAKRVTDWRGQLNFSVKFQNSAEFSGSLLKREYTWLFSDFDPTNKYIPGTAVLPAGTAYHYTVNSLGFVTDSRKLFVCKAKLSGGTYFNGRIFSLRTDMSYRWQPYGLFSLAINYTRIRLPVGFSKADFWLVGPKSEITFSTNLFWTTFLQYNSQVNNMNINSRLQWRFKPLSDLFLVYTDNYFAEDNRSNNVHAFGAKSRAVVLKFSYWLNP